MYKRPDATSRFIGDASYRARFDAFIREMKNTRFPSSAGIADIDDRIYRVTQFTRRYSGKITRFISNKNSYIHAVRACARAR